MSLVPAGDLRLRALPERLVAPRLEVLDRDALLLDPRVVAEVEDPRALLVRQLAEVVRRCAEEVLAEDLARSDLVEAVREELRGRDVALAVVHRRAVGGDGDDDVVGTEPVVLRGLDRAEDVADAREAERRQLREHVGGHVPAPREVLAAEVGAEEEAEPVGRAIRDRDRHVGVHHVVDQRDVLVADPLDVVLAEAVVEHRRALERLGGDDLRAVVLLQVVAGGDRSGRAGRGDERVEPQRRRGVLQRLEQPPERAAGREVVGDVVPELGELVEDDVLGIFRQQMAAVVDLLDVALRSRRPDDVVRIDDPVLEPREPLAAHAFREDGDAVAAHEARDGDAAAAVVAGRRPDGAVARRVELAGDDARREAAVGGEHLVRGDHREAVAERDDDARLDARQLGREHDVLRNGDDPGAGGVVEPVDAEEVERVPVVRPDGGEALAHAFRHEAGVGELRRSAGGRFPPPGIERRSARALPNRRRRTARSALRASWRGIQADGRRPRGRFRRGLDGTGDQ